MRQALRIVAAQFNALVGDINGNAERIAAQIATARDTHQADIVVFPELALTGYPPEDLLLRPEFLHRAKQAIGKLARASQNIHAVVGFPEGTDEGLFNACAWLSDNKIAGVYRKEALPNYGVFDEKRYFQSEETVLVMPCRNWRVGVVICEDLWAKIPVARAADAGAEIIVAPNASPYCLEKLNERQQVTRTCARENNTAILYCNQVGGQDDLVFDGQSFAVDNRGEIIGTAPLCKEGLFTLRFDGTWQADGWEPRDEIAPLAEVWRVLQYGLAEYVNKNYFPGVLIGLSGGIDSAVTAALAADALGPERVTGVTMASRHTQDISIEDSKELAQALSIRLIELPIDAAYKSMLDLMVPIFGNSESEIAKQNLQARIRGMALMAISNAKGDMVLATGNKSELAVGYATIYGDMCGGFAPLKDCYKTQVYRLAEYRNSLRRVIPVRTIERAPSAELADDQTDQDVLPPYSELDEILKRYVDCDQSVAEIVKAGFDEDTVQSIAMKVLQSEYKRRQSAPGTRITPRAFGRDRRYPITSGWL